MKFVVQCCHPELEKLITAEFIEECDQPMGAIWRCPICKREIGVSLQHEEEL